MASKQTEHWVIVRPSGRVELSEHKPEPASLEADEDCLRGEWCGRDSHREIAESSGDGDFLQDWLDYACGMAPDGRVDEWAEGLAEDDNEDARRDLAAFFTRFSVDRLEALELEAREALRKLVIREVEKKA